jgi:HlyD family secretion protein
MTSAKLLVGLALVALLGGVVFTREEPATKKQKAKAAKPAEPPSKAGVKVQKKPFKIELILKGTLEAEEAAQIAVRPHPFVNPPPSQGPLTIRKIAAHGSTVHKGDLLVAFDTRKINQVISDLESDLKVSDAAIKVAEEELPIFQKEMPLTLEAAARAHKRAQENLKYFLDVDRPQTVKDMDFLLKSAAFSLEYAKEELHQLEKMYKANDLTEETEEIILRRQRHAVERATVYLKDAEIDRDYVLKISLPRKEKDLRLGLVQSGLKLEKAKNTLAPEEAEKREALAKLRHDRDKNLTRLQLLRKDREGLTILAPMDGIVYHGKFQRGQWSLTDSQEGKLFPEGTVSPDEVFLTVVKPRPLRVRLTVEEKEVHLLKVGLAGKAKVPFDPDRKLIARVVAVEPVPVAPGKYEARVALDLAGKGPELVPGMGCSITFVPYAKKDALVVPAKAVTEEDDKHFVTVVHKDGKKERREVTPGRTQGGQTEILSGLREGEEVLPEPEDSGSAGPADKSDPKGG